MEENEKTSVTIEEAKELLDKAKKIQKAQIELREEWTQKGVKEIQKLIYSYNKMTTKEKVATDILNQIQFVTDGYKK